MDAETRTAFAVLAKLVDDTSQSLQAEMAEMRAETQSMRNEMERGFERVEAATRRNTSTLVGGAAAIAAQSRWAQQRDRLDTKRDRDLREIRARLQKVERALKRRAG
ncbi:MAG: hypothetical protein LAQ69_15820 [Acidobacteriia bacterium]|nr:hypothetical protein [Terriglobia bacterium]